MMQSKSGAGISSMARYILVPGNIRILALASMLTGTYISMLNTILQPFVVTNLNFGVVILGVLVAVGARPSGLASSIIQPFAGKLADILGRKPLILLGSAVGVCSMVAFFVAAETRSLLPLSVGYFLLGLSLLGSPASQAMTAETVAMDPGKVKIAFSVVFFFTALPGAVIPFFVGYLASSLGFAVLFAASAVLEAANLLALFPQLKETLPESHAPPRENKIRRGFSLREAVRLPPGFTRFFIPFAMDAFSFGIGGGLIYGLWSGYFHFSLDEIGLISGTLSVSIVATQYFATRILLAIGARRTLALSESLCVLVLLGWIFVPQLGPLLLISVVFGFSIATWVPAVSSMLMAAAPVEERGSIGGKLAAFRGLIAFPAPILGALIYDAYGYYVPVALSAVGISVTVVAILRLLPESGRSSP